MMEKFSNSRTEYWNQIKRELLDIGRSKDFIFRYVEIGQLLSHGFSITQLYSNPKELILKIWNAEYDNRRFSKGVYNLDRLAIKKEVVGLDEEELEKISRLSKEELDLSGWKGIILDGLFCQLEIKGEKLTWNCNEEINYSLRGLVELLRNKTHI